MVRDARTTKRPCQTVELLTSPFLSYSFFISLSVAHSPACLSLIVYDRLGKCGRKGRDLVGDAREFLPTLFTARCWHGLCVTLVLLL